MGLLELFRITGRVAVEYSEAQRGIEAVSGSADNTARSLGALTVNADETQTSIHGLGTETERARESTEGLGEETERTGEETENTNEGFTTWKATLANLASSVIQKAISKITELAKEIVGLGKDFTATMSEVKAISGASDEDFQKLTDTAREFGSKTVFSATEAAEALKYMSLAGWDAEQSSAALGGVLDLAAASGMGLGEASDMVTDYLSAFGMEAQESAYFADMLAYAQANSNTTASQLGEAYGNCGATLHAAGQDIETVTSFLEAMANQGLKGSEAGTALNATMRDITNSMNTIKDKTDLAKLAQDEFVSSTGDLNDLLGKNYITMGKTLIPVSDANGNFRDLTDILTDVSKATDGMGDAEKAAAMSSTFTSYSIKGVNLVLNEGIDKVAEYEENLRKADGSASDMASTMNDNLKGDLAGMNSALEELKLKIYDGLEEPLRNAVQFITIKVVPALTALMQNFDKIAPPILIAATAIGTFLIVANAGSILTAFTNGIGLVTKAFTTLNTTLLANPIALVIAAVAALVAAFIYLWNNCEGFRNFWINLWDNIKKYAGIAGEALVELINSIINFWANVNLSIAETWEKIKNFLKTAKKVLNDFVNDIIQYWVNVCLKIVEKCLEIKKFFKSIPKWFNEKIIQPITAFFSSLWDSITNKAKETWENIKKAFGKVGDFFSGIWDTFKSKFSSIGTAVGNAIGGAFKKAINSVLETIERTLNFIPDKVNPVLQTITDWTGVSLPFMPVISLPRLAKGGVVNSKTVAEIGEDGTEAVVPLEKNTEWTSKVAELINSKSNNTDIVSKLDELISIAERIRPINLTLQIENFNNTAQSSLDDISNLIKTTLYDFIREDKMARC